MRYNRPSTYLFLLSAVILSLGLIMAYFVYNTVENLKYDAGIINQTGIIRGSIQRVSKLVLSGSIQSTNEIITDINHSIERFMVMYKKEKHHESKEKILKNIQNLKEKWQTLEISLSQYQKTHAILLETKIIKESEICWNAADTIVLTAQLTTEDKVSGMKLFYIILFLNGISAIFVILLIFSYVRKKLEYETSHDPLTHIHNRRFYDYVIRSEIARSKRNKQPMSLILFDIDHFKNINDTYGHHIGDRALIDLSTIVIQTVRKSDSVFRVGGEEFAMIVPDTNTKGAQKMAEKVRKKIENHSFRKFKTMTISLGIAEFCQNITEDKLYHHADKALYLAKHKGRNRTEIYMGTKEYCSNKATRKK